LIILKNKSNKQTIFTHPHYGFYSSLQGLSLVVNFMC
jgi:hypothetical protein